ncbi:MAG: 1-phosphofructokinase family hexose kinase [Hespellia sp.]|nr:1-phosphofructokinase family hexose kinase [Hespellia sp.]
MIHTVTLNPAIDTLLYLDEFKKNVTNRLQKVDDTIGGKGTHVSINLKLLGLDSTAYGVVHGKTGQQILDLLTGYGIQSAFLKKEGDKESRTNFLLIEGTGDCCILASKGIMLTNEDIDKVVSSLYSNIQDGDYLILSGDATNCPDVNIYNTIINRLSDKHPKIFLDTSGATLGQCMNESPYLIKPNLDELSSLVDFPLETEDDIVAGIESLAKYNIEIIAVSLGGDGSIVKTPEGIYKIVPPSVNVRNTIGCGDCFLSGLIYGLANELNVEDILRIATACSAATAESNTSVGFDQERYQELISKVTIKKLK